MLLIASQTAFAVVQTVAVLPSEGVLKEEELEFLTDKAQEIAVRVLPQSSFHVFTKDAVIKRLGGAENYIKECQESTCIVDLGRKVSVDYVAQCNFGKLGPDFRITFELYEVSTSRLIDKFSEPAKDINELLAIMGQKIPEGFRKIPGAMPLTPNVISEVFIDHTPNTIASGTIGTLTDLRDGKTYKTVKIGTQTWMAENLSYETSRSKCYDNKLANCEKYGRLYNWETALKACPGDWHLPSISEWEILNKAVGGDAGVAKRKLQATNDWEDNGNGTDEFNFSALPGGYSSAGNFGDVGKVGYWWSASEDGAFSAYRLAMYPYVLGGVKWYESRGKSNLFSVRCSQGKLAAMEDATEELENSGGLGWLRWPVRIVAFTAAAYLGANAVYHHLDAKDKLDKLNDLKNDPQLEDAVKKSEWSRNICGGLASMFAIGGIFTFFF